MGRLTTTITAGAVAVAAAGCGSSQHDQAGPADVARAYVTAAYRCGQAGAGATYDLSTSPARTWSRAAFIAFERRHGCRPQPIPNLEVIELQQDDGVAVVQVQVTPDPSRMEGRGILTLVLQRAAGTAAWKVNTLHSDDPENLASS